MNKEGTQEKDELKKTKKEETTGTQKMAEEETLTANNNVDDAGDNEVDKLKVEIGEQKNKYLRLYSEFENFRRRTARERLDMIDTANKNLVAFLLPVLDDFERSHHSINEETTVDSLKEGLDLIQSKFMKVLEQEGLKAMGTNKGDDFDANLQEAITQIPVTEEKLKGKIVDVTEKGYYLGGKVVRFAKVVIGS